MTLQDRTKKILALLVAVLLVTAGGLATVVTLLVKDASPALPTITAYAHGTSTQVQAGVCNANLECDGLELVELPVPAGMPLQLSLPKDVADSNWRLNVQFGNPRTGEVFDGYRDYSAGEVYSVTVPSKPDEQLLGVIIQLPSNQGLAPVWAIQTLPIPASAQTAS
ncbi:DUF2771 family protein [Rhodococcus sp. ABRD24]|uniref:DUF2771 family protein n=1 Tax=Rhodococcus sp. ABRD24 TaxID=2507582 RepID=UPI001038658F|nr:DUF2771 family protein [Rhodococcus sp. ABRD24]QBJ97353.1 DUF2771 family protein [Rhodococcus sp. ABRD24]